MSEQFSKKIEEINTLLRSFGRDAVQEIKMKDRQGKVIGQVRYGYKPQYIFDAVNTILSPENWRYEVISKEIFDSQAVVEVRLFIRVKEEWINKGSQSGQMLIIKKNVGDAYKGAITDAIQKCFSTLSIGTDAYRGLLKAVYHGNTQNTPRAAAPPNQQPKQQAPPKTQQPPPADQPPKQPTETASKKSDFPIIAGIEYQQKNGVVVAVGNSFDKKELLKSAGFKWDGSEKNWYKETLAH